MRCRVKQAESFIQELMFFVRLVRSWPLVILLLFSPAHSEVNSLDELYNLFKVDLPAADIVILLDASGSMTGKYDAVRQAAIDFVGTLTDKDNLHLRVFASVVSTPLEGKGSEAVGRVNDFLPRVPLPGYGTDLGLAILKGIDFLEREGGSNVQAFFMLTDGLHQPLSDSPYSRDFRGDRDWQNLTRRAHALCQERTVFVYGFGIGQQTDIAVLRHVFPAQNVELVVGSPAEVANILKQVRDRLRRGQLRLAVEQELRNGKVQVRLAKTTISGNTARFNALIVVRNAYPHLPVILQQVMVQGKEPNSKQIRVSVEGDLSNVCLKAGEERQGQVKGILQVTAGRGLQLGKREQVYHAVYQFAPVAVFQHEAALNQLGFHAAKPNIEADALTVALTLRSGISLFTVVAMCLFLIFGFAAFLTRPVRRTKTSAVLRLIDFPAGIRDVENKWKIEADRTYIIGSKRGVDIYLPQTQPEHARVHLHQDGSFEVSQVSGSIQVEEQEENRIHFRVGRDYQFSVEVHKTKYWAFLPMILWGIAFLSLVLALASYFFDP